MESIATQPARPKSSIARERPSPDGKNENGTKQHKPALTWSQWPQRPLSNHTKESELKKIDEVGTS